MEFALTEEQQELVATVRSLLTKRADPRVETYDEALWQTLCEQIGVPALGIPEEYDGAGFSLFESLLALEEVGRSLAPSPLLSSLVTSEALLAGADEDAKQRLLPRIAMGEVATFSETGVDVLDGDLAAVVVLATDDGLVEVDGAEADLDSVDGSDHPPGHRLGWHQDPHRRRPPPRATGPGWSAPSVAPPSPPDARRARST